MLTTDWRDTIRGSVGFCRGNINIPDTDTILITGCMLKHMDGASTFIAGYNIEGSNVYLDPQGLWIDNACGSSIFVPQDVLDAASLDEDDFIVASCNTTGGTGSAGTIDIQRLEGYNEDLSGEEYPVWARFDTVGQTQSFFYVDPTTGLRVTLTDTNIFANAVWLTEEVDWEALSASSQNRASIRLIANGTVVPGSGVVFNSADATHILYGYDFVVAGIGDIAAGPVTSTTEEATFVKAGKTTIIGAFGHATDPGIVGVEINDFSFAPLAGTIVRAQFSISVQKV